jgi:hypothetical protein
MAGRSAAAKLAKLARAKAALSRATQARVGLELVDDRYEIVEPDNPLKLQTRTCVTRPDHISLDPAHHRQANDDAIAALQLLGIVNHEAMGRQVADVQMQIAVHEVLDNRREIDRMPRCTAQDGYT